MLLKFSRTFHYLHSFGILAIAKRNLVPDVPSYIVLTMSHVSLKKRTFFVSNIQQSVAHVTCLETGKLNKFEQISWILDFDFVETVCNLVQSPRPGSPSSCSASNARLRCLCVSPANSEQHLKISAPIPRMSLNLFVAPASRFYFVAAVRFL